MRKWLIWLSTLVVVIGSFGAYFGPQVRNLGVTQIRPAWPRVWTPHSCLWTSARFLPLRVQLSHISDTSLRSRGKQSLQYGLSGFGSNQL